MQQDTTRFLRALCIVSACLGSNGCTLTGWGAGAIVDAGSQKEIPVDEVVDLRQGRTVKLRLKDGRQLRGKFAGAVMAPEPGSFDADSAARVQQPDRQRMPALGQTVLALGQEPKPEAQLLGFDRTSVQVDETKVPVLSPAIRLWTKKGLVTVALADIEEVKLKSKTGRIVGISIGALVDIVGMMTVPVIAE